MTASPFVELRFNPTDLRPRDLPSAGAFLGSPADALEAALAVARAAMVDRMRTEVRGISEPSRAQLVQIADLAWQVVFHRFRVVSAPVLADAYLRAYRKANAGDVPMSLVYSLADKHTEKIGDYFHETSRDALAEGFTTYVNRQLSAKAAVDRVLDGYGLTPRQMRAYTSAKQFQTPVDSPVPRSIKAKARAYIDRSFTSRTKKLSQQEEHNIEEQAKQFAWMWLQEKKRLSPKAQKLWITAKDERVCKVCGPLHGKKVGVNERFKTAEGEFWSPGLHPNCRCVVRLLENRFSKDLAGSELRRFNQLHPRDEEGRFGIKARSPSTRTTTIDVDEEFSRITAPRKYTALDRTVDVDLEQKFQDVVSGAIHRQAIARPAVARGKVSVKGTEPQVKVLTVRPQVATVAPSVQAVQARVVGVMTDPQVRTEFTTKLVQDLKAQTRTPPDTSVKIIRAGTKAPAQPLEKPMYAVIKGVDFDKEGARQIALEHGMTFTADPEIAAELASTEVESLIEDVVQRLIRGPNGGNLYGAAAGSGLVQFPIQTGDLRKVVEWHASEAVRLNMINNPVHQGLDEGDVPKVMGKWFDDEGHSLMPAQYSYREIGQKLGLDPAYFDIRVVEADQGFMEKVHYDPDERGGVGSFEGDFEVLPESIKPTEVGDYHVTRMKVQPKRDWSEEGS